MSQQKKLERACSMDQARRQAETLCAKRRIVRKQAVLERRGYRVVIATRPAR